MPLSSTFDIKILFDLKAMPLPVFVFTDTNDYSVNGDVLTGGYIKITAPNGVLIYETPANTADFTPASMVLDTILIPTDVNNRIVSGEYIFEYTAITQNIPNGIRNEKKFNYSFCSPKVKIETLLDCFVARLQSRDKTAYAVDGVSPDSILRIHEIHFPSILNKAPLSSNSGLQEVLHPNLFEGTYTIRIDSTLTYDFGNAVSISTQVSGQKDLSVKCDTNLCKIYCCVKSFKLRLDQLKCENRSEYQREEKLMSEIISLMVLFEHATRCGKHNDAESYLNEILKVANCSEECGCRNCNGKNPKQIIPYMNAVVGGNGTNKWISGTGAPSSGLGNEGDFYLDTTGNIYEKAAGYWTILFNIKGVQGSPGQDGTDWLKGNGGPSASTGRDDDFYLDTATGDVYQKNGGNWGAPIANLKGLKGDQGDPGQPGQTGPPGDSGTILPTGFIAEYSGSLQNFDGTGLGINTLIGWALCNGNNGTPDLSGRFVVGYHPGDTDYNAIGKTGGAKTVALTVNQMPQHNHAVSVNSGTTGLTVNNANLEDFHASYTPGPGQTKFISSGNSISIYNRSISHAHSVTDPGHAHSVAQNDRGNNQAHENRPPYYTLAKIMKL